MNIKIIILAAVLVLSSVSAQAKNNEAKLTSPINGVLCDKYLCVNDKGVSRELTVRYISKKAAVALYSQGDFDSTQFTFSNGIFCDVQEKLCREDKYFGNDGKRNGAISPKYTKILFGK